MGLGGIIDNFRSGHRRIGKENRFIIHSGKGGIHGVNFFYSAGHTVNLKKVSCFKGLCENDDESPAPGAFTMTLFYEGTAENIRSFHSSLAKRFLSYELSEDKLILLFCDVTGELDLKDGEIGALFLDVPPEELVERLSVHFDGVCDRNGRELPAVYSVEYPAENGTSSSLRDKGETQDSSLDGSEGEKPGEGSKSPWGIFQVKKNQFLIFCLAIALFFLLWYLFKRKKKKELPDAQKKDSGPPSKGCG